MNGGGSNNKNNLSMQMDSIDRGSQTAEFGAIAAEFGSNSRVNTRKDSQQPGGYHAIVEEIC